MKTNTQKNIWPKQPFLANGFFSGPVHTAPVFHDGFLLDQSHPFTLLRFCTKPEGKTSVFVRSHCSGFVKLVVGYWSVCKKIRFCEFELIKCVFKNLCFCGTSLSVAFLKTTAFWWRSCADQCEHLHKNGPKTEVFSPFLYKNVAV